ncbi:anaphase-promoting complex subunit 4 [Chrysoperla carnea]|uniref:anaphase-promoting complex subunit 4 n=1 Tax=Chrysoperla carnea TaxID=189513 RepID=UPI001D05CE82|nr:anaphase-promoting complex subunit 4 [Chrysoperla carnea]
MCAMKQLEERHTSQEIKFLLWCDRMDLLAIANVRGEVSLHRLNWQRVWSLQPSDVDYTVSGMAWRPDGKVIAIGYSNGTLLLVDVETKRILYTQRFSSISCVIWFNAPDLGVDSPIEDDSSLFLSDLPDLAWDTGSANKKISDENLVDFKVINVLLVGTTHGMLHISIFGLFECAIIDLNKLIDEKCTVLSVHMANNLSYLYAIVLTKSGLVKVITLQTEIFKTHSTELHMIAYKHGKIISLLNYLEGTISSIEAAWEIILMEMDSKLASFASSVPEGAVAADFLDLLLFGFPSYELDLFLSQDLTEKGLRKLGHSIECSYSNIQKLVLKHLTKVAQNIAYYLSELRGMARMEFRYKILGLQESAVTKAISASGSFLVKGAEVQQVIDHSMRNYKAFFRWLYVVILRENEEHVPIEVSKVSQRDIIFIGEFLKNFDSLPGDSKQAGRSKYFNLERLGQYLVDSNLVIPLDTTLNPWDVFLSNHPGLFDNDLIIKHHHEMSLLQEHKHLISSIGDVFNEPKKQIGNELQLYQILNIIKVDNYNDIRLSLINFNRDITFMAIVNVTEPDGIYFIEIDSSNETQVKCEFFYFQSVENFNDSLSQPLKIIDIQFYTVNVLSVLLEIDNQQRTAVFAQFPVTLARQSLMVVDKNVIDSIGNLTRINACDAPISTTLRVLDGFTAAKFSVSGSRKVSVILMQNLRTCCLYEMDVDEEDEEEEVDVTASTAKESDNSIQENPEVMVE